MRVFKGLTLLTIFFCLTGCKSATEEIEPGIYYAVQPDNYQGSLTFTSNNELNPFIEIKSDNEIVISRGGAISYRPSGAYEIIDNIITFEVSNDEIITLNIMDEKFVVSSVTGWFEDFIDLEFTMDE
jgi:hypothetical protein